MRFPTSSPVALELRRLGARILTHPVSAYSFRMHFRTRSPVALDSSRAAAEAFSLYHCSPKQLKMRSSCVAKNKIPVVRSTEADFDVSAPADDVVD